MVFLAEADDAAVGGSRAVCDGVKEVGEAVLAN